MQIVPMTAAYAADIVTWKYPGPYQCYDMTSADPGFLVSPQSGYRALITGGALIGFRSFGADGQAPGGTHDATALDTGGGLRPELTGQGLGRAAIQAGLDFGERSSLPRPSASPSRRSTSGRCAWCGPWASPRSPASAPPPTAGASRSWCGRIRPGAASPAGSRPAGFTGT